MNDDIQVTREKLLRDFSQIVADSEQLLKAAASAGGEKAHAMRASIEQNLAGLRDRLHALQEQGIERTRAAARATDEYVHENPWQSIAVAAGVAAAVGVVLGLMLNRR